MPSKFALLTNLLLASVALATPSSHIENRLARRREGRQSKPLNLVEGPTSNVEYSSSWAGAVWAEPNGTFTTVTGTFIVPTLSGTSSEASVWVGIDGDTCDNAIFQTGVDFTASDGEVSYDAWYEWYPAYAYDFSGITINAGNQINTTVTAYSTTSGIAVIENLTTGQTVSQEITSSYALCGQNAEWILENLEGDGSLVPAWGFDTLEITSATASGPSGILYTPSGATIIEASSGEVTISGETITINT